MVEEVVDDFIDVGTVRQEKDNVVTSTVVNEDVVLDIGRSMEKNSIILIEDVVPRSMDVISNGLGFDTDNNMAVDDVAIRNIVEENVRHAGTKVFLED